MQTETSIVEDQSQPLPAAPSHITEFGEIALSLSGGGYRAAAFHLGVFDFLYRLGLLKKVRVLSTVSGGTFTGMSYAVSVAEKKDSDSAYREFYQRTYLFLKNTNVVKQALAGLQSRNGPFAKSMPSLIRSAADVYASETFLGDRRLGMLINVEQSPLRAISFNAVEFQTGIYFRFQAGSDNNGEVGNGKLRINGNVAADLRLADIAAASSCFPAGFEPIRFPDDFRWRDLRLDEVYQELGESFGDGVALMDGGIFDNQGIDSVKRIYSQKKNGVEQPPGLFIISDTSQRDEDIFNFPTAPRKGWLSLASLRFAAWLCFVLAAISAFSLVINGYRSFVSGDVGPVKAIFLYVIPFLLSLVTAAGLIWLRSLFEKGLKAAKEKTDIALWPFLKGLTTPELLSLIEGRVGSLIALTTSIFMKRVRRMGFDDIFVYEKYKGKLCPNLIYSLDDKREYGQAIGARGLQPSEKLRELARGAEGVGTNLWFTSENEGLLKTLIACGQASICFNLMKYVLEERPGALNFPESEIAKTFAQCEAFWKEINVNPQRYVDDPTAVP